MRNPLLDTLEIIESLSVGNMTGPELSAKFDLSPATLKRSIAEARLIGAEILSVKKGPVWSYHLFNWGDCRERCLRWIELEKARSLTFR
jgi:biotin operon repressor